MAKGIGIIAGLILLVLPIYAWIINLWGLGGAALEFLKGGIMWLLLLVGALSLIVGLADLKN